VNSDGYTLQERWLTAVESYRRSVDLYRRVLELRARARRPVPQLHVISDRLLRQEAVPTDFVDIPPQRPRLPLDPLTDREREVARLIACGYTNRQIAEALVLTRGTVANHVAHILSKLDLSNRTQLAAYVTRAERAGVAAIGAD
jgi:DNA-binding NarL/FixJ family response regulator